MNYSVGQVVRAKNGRYVTLRVRVLRGLKKTILWSAAITTLTWSYVGVFQWSAVAHAGELGYIAVPIHVEEQFPILEKIAKAESGGSQFGKDGQVIIHVNTPGNGYDIGKYQINSSWGALATKMGYNLYVEKDNTAFARYLFMTYGSEPWSSSKARWK